MADRRRSPLLLAVALLVACSTPGGGPATARKAAPLRGGDPKAARERYDEPLKARDFFALKRAPVGRTTLPVERYRLAREQMARMALYSTRSSAFVPRRSGSLGAAAADHDVCATLHALFLDGRIDHAGAHIYIEVLFINHEIVHAL